MGAVLDQGYNGRMRSLAGNYGKLGHGISYDHGSVTSAALPGISVFEANANRIHAFVQNVGADYTQIQLGYGGPVFYLYPGAMYEINALNPWTGQVWAISGPVDCTLLWGEAKLAGV